MTSWGPENGLRLFSDKLVPIFKIPQFHNPKVQSKEFITVYTTARFTLNHMKPGHSTTFHSFTIYFNIILCINSYRYHDTFFKIFCSQNISKSVVMC